jgi:hypothetical protein
VKDAFLSLKYKGVRTPWEVSANPVQYGWSCRKWIRHQSDPADKAALKAFADSLINDQEFRPEHFGRVSRIAEHVQRWRKDADAYSLEPDEREEYRDLRRLFIVVTENPSAIRGLLRDELGVTVPDDISIDGLPELIKASAVLRFIESLTKTTHSIAAPSAILKKAKAIAKETFSLIGESLPNGIKISPVDQFLIALEIDHEIELKETNANLPATNEKWILIENVRRPRNEFVTCDYRQGRVYVAANVEHPWLEQVGVDSEVGNSVLRAIGDAYLARLGDREIIEDFLAEFGISLSRRN